MHKFLTLANVSLNSLESQKIFWIKKDTAKAAIESKSNRVHSDIKFMEFSKDYDMLMCYASLTRLDL
jgi:hypothetical protein